jgi:hypothetical protein
MLFMALSIFMIFALWAYDEVLLIQHEVMNRSQGPY